MEWRCDQNGPPARRSEPDWRIEGAYLDRYVTEEQRSRRPIFIATLRAARLLTGCFVAHRSKTTAGILPLRFAHPVKIRSSATTPVTDLVHSKVTPHPVWLPSCEFLLLPFDKFGRRLRLATDRPWRVLEPSLLPVVPGQGP